MYLLQFVGGQKQHQQPNRIEIWGIRTALMPTMVGARSAELIIPASVDAAMRR